MTKSGLPSILAWSLAGILLLGGAIVLVFRLMVPSGSIDEFRNTVGMRQGIPERHLVPEDRRGWITVQYGVATAAPLETEGVLVYRYPEEGVLKTSTDFRSGLKGREYFAVGDRGLTALPLSGENRRIWGDRDISIGGDTEADPVERYSSFFVGTRAEHEQTRRLPPEIPGLPDLLEQP